MFMSFVILFCLFMSVYVICKIHSFSAKNGLRTKRSLIKKIVCGNDDIVIHLKNLKTAHNFPVIFTKYRLFDNQMCQMNYYRSDHIKRVRHKMQRLNILFPLYLSFRASDHFNCLPQYPHNYVG